MTFSPEVLVVASSDSSVVIRCLSVTSHSAEIVMVAFSSLSDACK